MKKKRTPEQNRRYRLHQIIKADYDYNAHTRQVEYEQKDVPMPVIYALEELRKDFGYNLQTFIS